MTSATANPQVTGHRSAGDTVHAVVPVAATAALLLLLLAFTHLQGLAVAGLTLLGIATGRISRSSRGAVIAIGGLLAALSVATILWFPRDPAIDAVYRPSGWLTRWYGLNLFSPASPAFAGSIQILGATGVVNVIIAVWLVARRNHVAGWITITPILALALPCIALPLAHMLASRTFVQNIVTFPRFLLAVPFGLAAVAALVPGKVGGLRAAIRAPDTNSARSRIRSIALAPGLMIVALAVAVCPADRTGFNRLFHAIARGPSDLSMDGLDIIVHAADTAVSSTAPNSGGALTIVAPTLAFQSTRGGPVMREYHLELVAYGFTDANPLRTAVEFARNRPPFVFIAPMPRWFFTPASLPGLLSRHWPPQIALYNQMGAPELPALTKEFRGREVPAPYKLWYQAW